MPIPTGQIPPALADYLGDLEARVAALENPGLPVPAFACTTANMPSAATYIGCVLRNTTLNILAHSDGTNWRRQDTGAVI